MKDRARRPSASLVISLLALFVALGGTGYAAIVVTGKNVKNSSLTGRDVRNGSLTGKDAKKDSIGGRQIKESSLGRVPGAASAGSAATAGRADTATSASTAGSADTAASAGNAGLLDGLDSLAFSQVRSVSSAGFAPGSPLTLTAAGYGTFGLVCRDNGTPAVADDDQVAFEVFSVDLARGQSSPA